MDDTHIDPSTSANREKQEPKQPSKPQRLGKGLAALLSKPPAEQAGGESKQKSDANESDSIAARQAGDGQQSDAERSAAPRASNDVTTTRDSTATGKSSLAADVVEDAVATLASHDDRVTALMERLEAAGELLAEVRRGEVARAQRATRIAWSVAAAIGFVLLLGMWWSASTIGSQHGELTAARQRAERLAGTNATQAADIAALQTDVADLTGDNAALGERSAGLSRELEQTRSALARANEVIDQLMRETTTGADAATGQASDVDAEPDSSERLAGARF